MKKMIAFALALIMVLSMGVVVLAATDYDADEDVALEKVAENGVAPGESFVIDKLEQDEDGDAKREWKVTYNFTTSTYGWKGASLIDSVVIEKDGDLVLTLDEALTLITEKEIAGLITLTSKTEEDDEGNAVTQTYEVTGTVTNTVEYIEGVNKASNAADDADISEFMEKNTVLYAEDGAGYVYFTDDYALEGVVKVTDDEKAQVYIIDETATEENDEDTYDAIEAYLGDDYDAIVEWYNFCGTGFNNKVDFQYDAYAEDPHYFYQWDGEKFVDLEAKFNDDEDVEKYEFTAAAKGVIIVTDVEIVAADEVDGENEDKTTENPDTGANDVVGVAAALAVVSLVAAGAMALKKK